MLAKRILVLGGTTEAREAADALQAQGHNVVFSLAGVTEHPLLPSTSVRKGGFGGAQGLASFITTESIDAVLDATHPFAAAMSRQAAEAAAMTGTRLVRLERPAWIPKAGETWINVDTLDEAAAALPPDARVLVTSGRKVIRPFIDRADLSGLIRTIEPPAEPLPHHWAVLQDRPPFELSGERDLLEKHRITHVVSKNSGGPSTAAKLEAAHMLGVHVVMVRRPAKPPCLVFSDVHALLKAQYHWLDQ